MSTSESSIPSAAAAPAVETTSHWAPHGAVLTACLVGINVLMILLIFFYFWRFFSGKHGPSSLGGGAVDDEAASSTSASSSPAASPRASGRLQQHNKADVTSSLPVSVYDRGVDDGKADCAVCIVEFRDGDLARRLPRCGHRFHAACVDAWLQRHATCPLCRGSVVAPFPGDGDDGGGQKNGPAKDGGGDGAECPV